MISKLRRISMWILAILVLAIIVLCFPFNPPKWTAAEIRQRADLINEKLQARTIDEWERFFNEAGIPAGPVYTMDGAMDHPQVRHREMVVERPHPILGTVSLLGLPVKLSETPGDVRRVPPEIGEHTDEILCELGLTEEARLRLREKRVV